MNDNMGIGFWICPVMNNLISDNKFSFPKKKKSFFINKKKTWRLFLLFQETIIYNSRLYFLCV